jgi:hypothetical protein
VLKKNYLKKALRLKMKFELVRAITPLFSIGNLQSKLAQNFLPVHVVATYVLNHLGLAATPKI